MSWLLLRRGLIQQVGRNSEKVINGQRPDPWPGLFNLSSYSYLNRSRKVQIHTHNRKPLVGWVGR
jgi:hypothetical protein